MWYVIRYQKFELLVVDTHVTYSGGEVRVAFWMRAVRMAFCDGEWEIDKQTTSPVYLDKNNKDIIIVRATSPERELASDFGAFL